MKNFAWKSRPMVALMFLTLFAFSATGTETLTGNKESAVRGEHESFESALERYLSSNVETSRTPGSAVKRARPYRRDLNISALPVWPGTLESLRSALASARDERLYIEKRRPRFPRRATWLYPDNGCFARAAHIARSFLHQGYHRPGQVFAFGKLRMATEFKSKGLVRWWYHVAAGVRIASAAYVLDPAVDPYEPLELEEWLSRMSHDPFVVKVSICDPNAYAPRSRCEGGAKVSDKTAVSDLEGFLPQEWNRLKSLRLSPEELLGDDPPWHRPAQFHPLKLE